MISERVDSMHMCLGINGEKCNFMYSYPFRKNFLVIQIFQFGQECKYIYIIIRVAANGVILK